ncbi:MAG: lamin tail domain-containing protein, partial [Acidimicrobiia bacterium]|nr:lamin tail domain-containing protein [Acidimicrobiia bacterium]
MATAGGLIAALLIGMTTHPALAAPVVVASDLTGGAPMNLISFTDDPAIPFTSAGDGFQKYQRGVSPSIPFAVLDDSLTIFPGDTLGIVDETNTNPFFGVVDTVNPDNAGLVSATWDFDISGASELSLSIDMGAMGDFESSDSFEWTYSIDGGAPSSAFSLVSDQDADRTYTLAGGASFTLADPLNVGATQLSNVFQTVSTPIAGTGSSLALSLTVTTDGGSEGVAFQNIVITGDDSTGSGPTPGDLVITEVMQNPAEVSDANGEWFEIRNVSASSIDLDGWVIGDDGSDTHTIVGSVVVAPGGHVVLGPNANSATNGGVTVDYSYGSGWFLANGDDEIILVSPEMVEFDRIEYDGGPTWPDPNGRSMNLDPTLLDVTSNDDGANWCQGSAPYGDGDLGTPGADNTTCEQEPTSALIHEIQGAGPTVAITGLVEVQAIVTSLFQRDDVLDGFFIQEEDGQVDGDTATSEGIFVFCRGNCPSNIATGDLVTVIGDATEAFEMSQIDMRNGSVVVDSSGNALPSASSVDLPATASTLAEATFESV